MPEVCENSFAARVERSAEPVRTGVAFERMQRGLCRSFAGWPAIVSVAALLVAGCGELSDPTRTECEASHAPSSDRFQELSPAAEKRLQGTLDRVRREQKAPGAAAAVVIGGCLWVGASGIADMRTREPVRVQTMFEVGSVTKTFVAALVLKLAEDGVLGLDDRLSRWVPEFPASRGITLRELLNHTAGTDDFVGDGRFLAAQPRRGLRRDVDTAATAALRARAGGKAEGSAGTTPPPMTSCIGTPLMAGLRYCACCEPHRPQHRSASTRRLRSGRGGMNLVRARLLRARSARRKSLGAPVLRVVTAAGIGKHMGFTLRSRAKVVVLAVLASLVAVAPATAQTNRARGTIIIEGLTLAGTQYGTPSGQPTTVATDPLSIPVREGDTYTYSTITCATSFPPWNSFGLHFDPNFPGVNEGPTDRGASVRHELRGTVTKLRRSGVGTIEGTLTTFLCEGGVRTDRIISSYKAKFWPSSATSVELVGGGPVPTSGGLSFAGRYEVESGTGRFEDLESRGFMRGQFTCLPQSLTRNRVASCTALGGYSEVALQLRGLFRQDD